MAEPPKNGVNIRMNPFIKQLDKHPFLCAFKNGFLEKIEKIILPFDEHSITGELETILL